MSNAPTEPPALNALNSLTLPKCCFCNRQYFYCTLFKGKQNCVMETGAKRSRFLVCKHFLLLFCLFQFSVIFLLKMYKIAMQKSTQGICGPAVHMLSFDRFSLKSTNSLKTSLSEEKALFLLFFCFVSKCPSTTTCTNGFYVSSTRHACEKKELKEKEIGNVSIFSKVTSFLPSF